MDVLWSLIEGYGRQVIDQLPLFAAVGALFTALGFITHSAASKGPWWRKPDILTDLIYAFVIPGVSSYVRLAFLVVGAALITGVSSSGDVESYLTEGRGILAGLPFWAQCVIYLVCTDLILYWTHRIFHSNRLWRYHAVHHSSEHLDWLSAFRFHPVNTIFHSVFADAVLLLCGVPASVLIFLAPFNLFMSGFVHADVDWDLGPFKYVVASPVFHRWHHTDVERGGEKNFAPTFPVIDMIFGTFYMPKDRLPDAFGVDDPHFPKAFEHQMLYPFKAPRQPAE